MARPVRVLALLACGLTLAACGADKGKHSTETGKPSAQASIPETFPFAIEHVTMLSMIEGAAPRPDMTVLVRNGHVAAIEPTSGYAVPAGVRAIDGTGKWLMPALTDMHVHIETRETMDEEGEAAASGKPINDADVLLPYVANGVLQVMNLAATPGSLRQRAAVEAGQILGPRMALAPLVDGSPPIWPESISRVAKTPADGRAIVKAIQDEGYGFVKTYSKLSPDTFIAIVDEARQRGLSVVGHLPGRVAQLAPGNPALTERLLRPGFSMVAHAEEFAYQSREMSSADIARFADLAKANGTALISTLVLDERIIEQMKDLAGFLSRVETRYMHPYTLYGWVFDNRYAKSASPERIERLTRVVEFNRELIRALVAKGVPVVAGTDSFVAGLPPGFALHDELAALVQAGMSTEQALASATRVPARLLGVEREQGTLEAGKRADLLLLGADPLADIAHTRRIAAVISNGRYLTRTELDERMSELATRYAAWSAD